MPTPRRWQAPRHPPTQCRSSLPHLENEVGHPQSSGYATRQSGCPKRSPTSARPSTLTPRPIEWPTRARATATQCACHGPPADRSASANRIAPPTRGRVVAGSAPLGQSGGPTRASAPLTRRSRVRPGFRGRWRRPRMRPGRRCRRRCRHGGSRLSADRSRCSRPGPGSDRRRHRSA